MPKDRLHYRLSLANTPPEAEQELKTFVSSRNATGKADAAASAPKISIVMCSYNQADFIERSILSVLNQNYPNLELIVIDGNSTDETRDIIRRYENEITYWVSEPDGGQSDALNKGFARASGDIFGWLNSDDLYTPGALQEAAALFGFYPDVQIVYGDYYAIGPDDHIIYREFAFDFKRAACIYDDFRMLSQAAFWRRGVHERFPGFDPDIHRMMDYAMLMEFSRYVSEDQFKRTDKVLGCFRRHPQQKTQEKDAVWHKEFRSICQRHEYPDRYSKSALPGRTYYKLRALVWMVKRNGVRYAASRALGLNAKAH